MNLTEPARRHRRWTTTAGWALPLAVVAALGACSAPSTRVTLSGAESGGTPVPGVAAGGAAAPGRVGSPLAPVGPAVTGVVVGTPVPGPVIIPGTPLPATAVPPVSPKVVSPASPMPPASPASPPTVPRVPRPLPALTGSGVRGTVTAGPTCPVEQVNNPCPPRPVSATVSAQNAVGVVVGTTTTAPDGSFQLALPAGSYQLVAAVGGPFPRCPTVAVTVPPNATVTADIPCDTGIR